MFVNEVKGILRIEQGNSREQNAFCNKYSSEICFGVIPGNQKRLLHLAIEQVYWKFVIAKKKIPSIGFLVVIMASGIARGRANDDKDDDVAQHSGHTPTNRLIETRGHGLQRTSLILDIHFIVNLHLPK